MVRKIYRYRIDPAKKKEFLEVQRLADMIYSEHVKYELKHLQNDEDPWEWVEIQTYADETAMRKVDRLSEREPELKKLFLRFTTYLDPKNSIIHESRYHDYSVR